MGSWNAGISKRGLNLLPERNLGESRSWSREFESSKKQMGDITLKSHRDYMKRMFSSMTIRDAERHSGFIEALYATEAFLVEKARKELIKNKTDQALLEKDESPAFAELSPIYIFSIANEPEAVNT